MSGESLTSLIKQYLMVSKNKIRYSCEDGIENPVPRYHRLSSPGKPRDANR